MCHYGVYATSFSPRQIILFIPLQAEFQCLDHLIKHKLPISCSKHLFAFFIAEVNIILPIIFRTGELFKTSEQRTEYTGRFIFSAVKRIILAKLLEQMVNYRPRA